MGEARIQGRSVLLLACGALARELLALKRLGGWDRVAIECLPSNLHNTPGDIPEAVRAKLEQVKNSYDEVFVAYADCGTGGRLDAVLAEYGVERLPGAHCYEFYAGAERFAALHEVEIGTFYLTDFMVRQFDAIVIRGLGLDRHPELCPSTSKTTGASYTWLRRIRQNSQPRRAGVRNSWDWNLKSASPDWTRSTGPYPSKRIDRKRWRHRVE